MATIKLQNGKVVLKDGKASCSCCGKYTLCIDNSNAIKDNSWNVSINNNYIAYYDGSEFFNQCFDIPTNYLNLGSSNELEFSLAVCQSDDFFVFYITDQNGNQVYNGDFGGNGSYFDDGTCSDTYFTRNFNL